MRKLITAAVLLAATTGVTSAATITGALSISAINASTKNFTVTYYLNTDTTDGTGDVTDHGIASAQLDLLSTTGQTAPTAVAVFPSNGAIRSGDFNRQNATLEAASAGGYAGNDNLASIGTFFFLTYADAVTGSQNSGLSAPFPDFTVGTPLGSPSVTLGGKKFTTIATQVWHSNGGADTLQLKILPGSATYFDSTDSAHTNVPSFDTIVNATIDVPAAGPSISLASTAAGTTRGTLGVSRQAAGKYLPGVSDGTDATDGNYQINGLVGTDGGPVPVLIDFTAAATGADIDAFVAAVPGATKLASTPDWATGLGGSFDVQVLFASNPGSPAFFNFSGLGGSLAIDRVAAIPEPATAGLVALGAAAGLLRRRRRSA